AQYEIVGLKGKAADNSYGLAEKITMDKQDFQGIRAAYEFDPTAEKYIPVDPMKEARWYPTLVGLEDGKVLAVSGLDDVGAILPGDNEVYDPKTKKWTKGPFHYFPTYPALFLTKGGKLF
ncbi:galactose oxidase, partial [Streptomyces sp. SID8455]|nr:galactose oxidase [Streptomyces sp. SID8455]